MGEAVSEGCAVSWDAVVAGGGAERVYVTMDSWECRAAYGELDRECTGMMASEKHLGEYER